MNPDERMRTQSRRAIEILDYDPNWPGAFIEIHDGVSRLLSELIAEVHHVGSTSVPGLCAKPKIDVDIVLRSAAAIPAAIERMKSAGYVYHGDSYQDGMWTFTHGPAVRGQRLYLCAPDTPAHQRRLLFRDYLRDHSEAAAAYAALKRRLAVESGGDWEMYGRGKGPFIADIVRRAALTCANSHFDSRRCPSI